MNLLFIYTLNQWRSPTAEAIFKYEPGLSVRSAGTASNAAHHVNSQDIDWAEVIFVMEKKHQEYIEKNFKDALKNKRLINLNVPDDFENVRENLDEILRREVGFHLNRNFE